MSDFDFAREARSYLCPSGQLDSRFEGECGTIVTEEDIADLTLLLRRSADAERERFCAWLCRPDIPSIGHHSACPLRSAPKVSS